MSVRRLAFCLTVLLGGCAAVHTSPPQIPAGSGALDLVLPRSPGPGQLDLSTLRGRVVLVDFWATWCAPCHDAAIAYQSLYTRLHAQGLEVIGVSVDDDPSGIGAFSTSLGLTYPMLSDPSAAVSQGKYGLTVLPSVLIADRAGVIRYTHAGFGPGDAAAVASEVEKLLGEPAQ